MVTGGQRRVGDGIEFVLCSKIAAGHGLLGEFSLLVPILPFYHFSIFPFSRLRGYCTGGVLTGIYVDFCECELDRL